MVISGYASTENVFYCLNVVLYTEFCKRQRPSVYAAEVQKELIENQVVLPANVPSQASISRVLTSVLAAVDFKNQLFRD